MAIEEKHEIVILFAGDSGDGMQLTGNQFTTTAALFGNDIATFPNFPAEIRAPKGTVAGVSGFKLKFGDNKVYTPGDQADVLVAMNAAALKANITNLKTGGILIVNNDGFDKKNLKLAHYDVNPLETPLIEQFEVHAIDITQLTVAALSESGLDRKAADRSKNMFVLGLLYWMFDRSMQPTIDFIESKFANKPEVAQGNISVLKAGYNYGETTETHSNRYRVQPAKMEAGEYRNIMGNQATAIGLIAAAQKAGLELFFGSYPITPASDILHELSKQKKFGVKTFQAEDEIAAICSAIGASFAGSLGVTASSGPGIALKGEAMGLAVMLEIPLVIINVQRGGPSTGLPTKTEQADLMQALYGRNGEAPMPVLAISSPSTAFETVFEAAKLAIEHMTPVMVLSDSAIANGSEPWKFPKASDLPLIQPQLATAADLPYLPYQRGKDLVRKWAIPGMAGFEHRIGGLEKQALTGDVSYDPDNHQEMINTRRDKVENVANSISEASINSGKANAKLAIVTWGSTAGVAELATKQLLHEGYAIAHLHLTHLHPMQHGTKELLDGFDQILVPEMNDGQMIHLIKGQTNTPCIRMNKAMGIPFTATEIVEKAIKILEE